MMQGIMGCLHLVFEVILKLNIRLALEKKLIEFF